MHVVKEVVFRPELVIYVVLLLALAQLLFVLVDRINVVLRHAVADVFTKLLGLLVEDVSSWILGDVILLAEVVFVVAVVIRVLVLCIKSEWAFLHILFRFLGTCLRRCIFVILLSINLLVTYLLKALFSRCFLGFALLWGCMSGWNGSVLLI